MIIKAAKDKVKAQCPIKECSEYLVLSGEKCVFKYLPERTKNEYLKSLKLNESRQNHCKVPDCKGQIKTGKCLKCG